VEDDYQIICVFVPFLLGYGVKNTPFVIAICGGSGSGKSFFSNVLAKHLTKTLPSYSVQQLSLDRYFFDIACRSLQENQYVNFDHPDAIDFGLFASHLVDLKNKGSIYAPKYDFVSHKRENDYDFFSTCDLLIVEGVFLFYQMEIVDLLDLKLFIETPLEICLQRRLSRDLKERGRTENGISCQFKQTVIPMYKKYIHQTRAHANFLLDGVAAIDENITFTVEQLSQLICD
tara:strand:+ start:135 stop:827 length:693 start_codon:yes stop_codon:yes gene_type:complete